MLTLSVTNFPIPLVEIVQPDGITKGSDGNLWFTENASGQIGRMTPRRGCSPSLPCPRFSRRPDRPRGRQEARPIPPRSRRVPTAQAAGSRESPARSAGSPRPVW